MNLDEETLRIVQRQKVYLKSRLDKEWNDVVKCDLKNQIKVLSEIEEEILGRVDSK